MIYAENIYCISRICYLLKDFAVKLNRKICVPPEDLWQIDMVVAHHSADCVGGVDLGDAGDYAEHTSETIAGWKRLFFKQRVTC